MRSLLAAGFVALLSVTQSGAQTNAVDGMFTPRAVLPAPDRKYADWASTATVAASIAKDTWDSFHAPNKKDALIRQGIRDLGVVGVSALLKAVTHRTRPDGSSNDSWPSEHTMFPALLLASCGKGGIGHGGFAFSIPLTIGTGAGRIAANRHWLTDVGSGALIGGLIGHFTMGCH